MVAAWVALNVTVPLPTRVIAPVDALMVATLETSVVVEYVMAPAGLYVRAGAVYVTVLPNTTGDVMANVLDQGFVPSSTVNAHDALPASYWDVWVCAAVIVVGPDFKTVTRPLDESTVATVVSLLVYETAVPRELVAATLNVSPDA